MLIAVAHNAVAADAPADERDVLVQVEAVSNALRTLGHEPVAVAVTLDLESFRRRIAELRPSVAFNLVEALGGTDRLSPAVPLLLETLGIPYTGNSAETLHVTNSKRMTKERLAPQEIPTPAAITIGPGGTRFEFGTGRSSDVFPGRFLLKAVHEHASFAMDDAAVISAHGIEDVAEAVHRRSARLAKPFFAEQFIDGREFNLSVLSDGEQTSVLPAAEISFASFPPDKPRIVGYAAKWEAESFEFNETPRRFDFPPEDEPLLGQLRALAVRTWLALDLRGYARVDFRVDEAGRPWVIEANANPCLSPDAGFAAALTRAGIPFPEAVRRILAAT